MRPITVFSPLPPTRSGISDYTREQIAHLKALGWSVSVVIDDQAMEPDCSDISWVRHSEWEHQGEVILYHLGNNLFHEYIYREALKTPGSVVLHDFSLHHLLVETTLGKAYPSDYISIMEGHHGDWGRRIASARVYESRHSDLMQFFLPLNGDVLAASNQVFVHSMESYRRLLDLFPLLECHYIPFPCEMGGFPKPPSGNALIHDDEKLKLMSLGFVTPTKQIELVLEALASVCDELPDFCYHIVGEVWDRGHIDRCIARLGLEKNVRVWEFVDFDTLTYMTEAADIVVGLRYPSAGETSAALFRSLARGKINVVFEYGSFSELPDEIVIKVPVDSKSHSGLASALLNISNDQAKLSLMGMKAKQFVRTFHDPKFVARLLTKILRR